MKPADPFWTYKTKDWIRDITSLGNPLILLFVPFCFFGASKIFLYLLGALLLNEIFCSAIKMIFHRKRPDGQQFEGALEKLDAGSFPSIHSSRIATAYLTMAAFADSLILQLVIIIFIMMTAVSRVLLKRHFVSDILGGLVIGTLIFSAFYIWVYPS